MKKINIFLTVSIVFLSLIFGCSSSGTGVQNDLLNGKWILQKINDKEVILEKSGGEIPYLNFNVKLNLISGSTGCNIMDGKTLVTSDEITFSGMSMTKIFCPDAEYEVSITGYLFNSAPLKYKVSNNELTLSKDDKVVMTFKKS